MEYYQRKVKKMITGKNGLPLALKLADTRPKYNFWAPGNYQGTCSDCGRTFIGDKRAATCSDCAYTDVGSQELAEVGMAVLERLEKCESEDQSVDVIIHAYKSWQSFQLRKAAADINGGLFGEPTGKEQPTE